MYTLCIGGIVFVALMSLSKGVRGRGIDLQRKTFWGKTETMERDLERARDKAFFEGMYPLWYRNVPVEAHEKNVSVGRWIVRYLPGSTEYYNESGTRVVEVVTSEIRMRPAKPGDQETVSINLQLDGVTSTAIQMIGRDIDDVSETTLLVNDHNVDLPAEIVADVAPKTVTIELEDGVLREGKNTITFVFAEAFGGTTGFSILDVRILLRD